MGVSCRFLHEVSVIIVHQDHHGMASIPTLKGKPERTLIPTIHRVHNGMTMPQEVFALEIQPFHVG